MNKENKLFYFGILPALVFQFIGAFFYFIIYSDGETVRSLYTLTKIFIIIWPLFWIIAKFKLPTFSSTLNKQKSLILGLLFGLFIIALGFIVYAIFKDPLVISAKNIIQKAESWGLVNYYIFFAIFVSLIHSFIEEYYWRWFVYRGLTIRFSWLTAAVITSIAFASHHYIILSEFFPLDLTILFGTMVGIGGFVWCWMYKRTGSLLGSWLSHVVVDGVVFFIGYLLIFS